MAEFRMPSLGADMTEGTVLEWLVKPGDTVHKGDVVAVVDTAKAAVDVECFASGRIGELLVPEGEKVPVGTPLATITDEAAATAKPAAAPVTPAPEPKAAPAEATPSKATPPAAPPEAVPVAEQPRPAPAPPPHAEPAKAPARPKPPLASPPVRTFAAHAGVDLATVHGTGRDGAITRTDVEHALAPPRRKVTPYARRLAKELGVDLATVDAPLVRAREIRAAAAQGGREPARRDDSAMRQAIAALMARSKREIPHYYLSATIDLGPATAWLREHNRRVPVGDRVLPAALLLRATALAVRTVPQLNGFWTDDAFHAADEVNLGVAISLRGGGLIAPALGAADTLPLGELMRRLRDLVSRARSGRLRSSELTSATITVTNLGDLGVESVQGVIYPPQVALVGFGAIAERPWAVDGLLGIRPLVTATLAGDHRASDGATGARLLTTLATLLRNPEEL
ncbi:2-oxo acid dehydrogenase subunit E2 [Amycolatopsis sp. K13G38]|uniref:Dihydrolipoamide acetyltransferase component of pyruvate dehydrogenase complex n=1 Tax=Amycolatopsis acididurans TaxID=2724524 RepID=A0ABX1J0N0_9PSEU|nr:dihydrolipoamide acetyltransferase family protein [Amycolatopsis acididurans]NKQ51826.1 2-oxo acid dehydrogenase subunit E2 [Amycolatopsis acididurans]